MANLRWVAQSRPLDLPQIYGWNWTNLDSNVKFNFKIKINIKLIYNFLIAM